MPEGKVRLGFQDTYSLPVLPLGLMKQRGEKNMKRNIKFGIGMFLAAMLLVSMAFAPAASAKKDKDEGDVGILSINVDGGT